MIRILVVDRLAGGRLRLRAEHALAVRTHGRAATLDIPGVGAVPMFLHPDDPVSPPRCASTTTCAATPTASTS